MEPTEQLEAILPAVSDLVDRLDPADLDNETPCEHFTLHDVLDHMIVLGGSFSYLFRGEEPPAQDAPEADGRVPAPEFRKVMDDLLDAVRSEGALARTIVAPVGAMPGETFARLVAFDGLVHGFDIARSAGLTYDLPTEVVTAVDTFARAAITDDMRDGDTFKDPTTPPDGANRIERVAAFSGRTV
jgi:uncharacterized protein (TIGR03086 family)